MKNIVLVLFLFFGLATVGGYCVLDHLFPKSAPIICPDESELISISVGTNSDVFSILAPTEYQEILNILSEAEPTRTMSVNDYPSVRPYYTLVLTTSSREYRYFIYEDRGQIYIEIPYEGIYGSDKQLLDLIIE